MSATNPLLHRAARAFDICRAEGLHSASGALLMAMSSRDVSLCPRQLEIDLRAGPRGQTQVRLSSHP
jgi:hypothetical protein